MEHTSPNHPRYHSLLLREKMAQAYLEGILADTALIAHGRGEAFDYILGEKTNPPALKSIKAAAAVLLLADNPVLSINGNTAVLAAEDIVKLAKCIPARVEINLFYRTPARVGKVAKLLEDAGAEEVLGKVEEDYVPVVGLEGPRSRAHPEGVHRADVVFVPLEDGDRAEALTTLGKTIITIDLNPLSRTAQTSSITIVDNLVRAIPLLIKEVKRLKGFTPQKLSEIVREFDNMENISESRNLISQYLKKGPKREE